MANEKPERVRFDEETKRWFHHQPLFEETTVVKCESCGLHYKPILGHKCRRKKYAKRTTAN